MCVCVNGVIADCPPPSLLSVYLALRANDRFRRFINIYLHYIFIKDSVAFVDIRLKKLYGQKLWAVLFFLLFFFFLLKVSWLICAYSWCFEPSQPLGGTPGLNTNSNQSLSYSAHKSFNINHDISTSQLYQTYTHTQITPVFTKAQTFYITVKLFLHTARKEKRQTHQTKCHSGWMEKCEREKKLDDTSTELKVWKCRGGQTGPSSSQSWPHICLYWNSIQTCDEWRN